MSIEAMKQALDALEESIYPQQKQHKAITALRQAIAQAEKHSGKCGCGANLYIDENGTPCSKAAKPEQAEKQTHTDHPMRHWDRTCPACVEQAEKQEPVAYLCENAVGHKYFRWKKPTSHYKPIALYTSPPRKEWVGLTEDELVDLYCQIADETEWAIDGLKHALTFARLIQAHLKGLNT